MPATVANFFSKLMFHIFRNEIWTITTNSLAKSTPALLQKIMLGNCLDECGMDHGCLSMPDLKLALVQVPSHMFTG